jgi:hypothetical protein
MKIKLKLPGSQASQPSSSQLTSQSNQAGARRRPSGEAGAAPAGPVHGSSPSAGAAQPSSLGAPPPGAGRGAA